MADQQQQQQPQAATEQRFLTPEERQQMQRLFGFPEEFPRDFGSWLVEYLAVNGLDISYKKVRGLSQFVFDRGAAFPDNPKADQFFQLDVAEGVAWLFRYNEESASAYKWECIGGVNGSAEVTTAENALASGAYGDLTTTGPAFTVPRAGDYEITAQCVITGAGDNGQSKWGYMSYALGGTPADDAWAARFLTTWNLTVGGSAVRTYRHNGVAAGTAVTAKYKFDTNGTSSPCTFFNRILLVRPIRLA